MKLNLFADILSPKVRKSSALYAVAFTITSTATLTQPSYAQNQKFFCGMSKGVPATLVRTSRGNIPMIRWVDAGFAPPWIPERRCEEISARFQRFYENGTLNFLRTGRSERQPVLCVAAEKGGPCLPEGILLTLKPGKNPEDILQQLFNSRGGASPGIVELGGDSSRDVVSSEKDAAYLDVQKLLSKMEGRESTSCPAGQPLWKC
ncbi:hypothetical protein DP113_22200 [Brasilonema octagenarum UFV-E1]|uniref:Uncharacterized protein n=2 Tax=Brasilonema TaxID=383614 RepID=A0A856ML16_9CYAN|nr:MULTISPECIES: COP23 domain-containing protein [Brasilonema]NMF65837.1 hypothetical protein [Brasilonema octagenarum UFV-OR1]QDL10261.1 hypothetical protein DP114_22285 [Brasilonema sennae CENA114]QDL16611.1 hypothetical protein DP113_22200 [Brasilonema octagenarum UFV-E1]